MTPTGQVRKRGAVGRVFLYVFYGFNVLMLLWLISYWGTVGPSLHTGSHAEQAGAAIGTTLGTGFIIFFWALGSIITGLLVFFTRGQHTYPEGGRDDFRASAFEPTTSSRTFEAAVDARGRDERRRQFGQGRPQVVASSSKGWSWSGVAFWAFLAFCGLLILGALGEIADPEGARARQEAREVKQQQTPAQPLRGTVKEVTSRKEGASSFSNFLSVDNIRLGNLTEDTLAYVTVRIHTKIHHVKCAMRQGSRYIGVGDGYDASPPAADILVTLPGQGYGSGSSLRADCSSE